MGLVSGTRLQINTYASGRKNAGPSRCCKRTIATWKSTKADGEYARPIPYSKRRSAGKNEKEKKTTPTRPRGATSSTFFGHVKKSSPAISMAAKIAVRKMKLLTESKVESTDRCSDDVSCSQRAGSSPLNRADDLWEPKHGIHAGDKDEGERGRDDHANDKSEEQKHPEPCWGNQ